MSRLTAYMNKNESFIIRKKHSQLLQKAMQNAKKITIM